MKTLLFWAVVIILASAAGCAMLIRPAENAMIFFPKKPLALTPEAVGIPFREVSIMSGGYRLHGWLIPGDPGRWSIIYFHGNAENVGDLPGVARFLAPLGANILMADYRGYGKSQGAPSLEGIAEDAVAVVDWMMEQEKVPPGRIIIWGRSLGAAAALEAMSQRPGMAGVIVEAGFTSLKDMASQHMALIPGFMVRDKLNNLSIVPHVAAPKLFIHGKQDMVVPYSHGERLYEAASEPKRLLPLPEAGHNDTYMKSGGAILAEARAWLDGL